MYSPQVLVDGKEVATREVERTLRLILRWGENLDVGSDTGSPVDDADYQAPLACAGKIDKISLTIDRLQLSPEDIKRVEMAQRNNRVSE